MCVACVCVFVFARVCVFHVYMCMQTCMQTCVVHFVFGQINII